MIHSISSSVAVAILFLGAALSVGKHRAVEIFRSIGNHGILPADEANRAQLGVGNRVDHTMEVPHHNCSNTTVAVEVVLDELQSSFKIRPALAGDFLFYAAMKGPADQYFGCFLELQGGLHSCKDLSLLDSGVWAVDIILVRTRCVSKRWPAHMQLGVVDYIMADQVYRFEDFSKVFKYPFHSVLQFNWNATASPWVLPVKKACRDDWHGMWIPYTGKCQPSCHGLVDEALLWNEFNKLQSMNHIFKPFSCRYHFFSKAEAQECINRTRPLMVGDSRMRFLREHADAWLGMKSFDGIGLESPHHIGISLLLKSKTSVELSKAIAEGRTIVMNSLLHDVAPVGEWGHWTTTTEDFRYFWNLTGCGLCTDHLAANCNCTKYWSVQKYILNIKSLRAMLLDVLGGAAGSSKENRVFWVSMNKRPPIDQDEMFDWQTPDVLLDLESKAVGILLERIRMHHIDVRPQLWAAPARWWLDSVHFGMSPESFFQHSILQTILNSICLSNGVVTD
jgi:hypothetical protein